MTTIHPPLDSSRRLSATRRCFLVAATILFLTSLLNNAVASVHTVVPLFNHRDGNAAPPYYGLRIDDSGVNTFSFESDNQQFGVIANSTVTMKIFPGPSGTGTGKIEGTIIHNQSGAVWSISAMLEEHQFTFDADPQPWTTQTDLFPEVLDVAQDEMTNVNSLSNLKNASTQADRIAFTVVSVTLDPDSGNTSAFNGGQQMVLNEFPSGDPTKIPFMIVKGHRISIFSDRLVGFGWLREDSQDTGNTRDFLFEIGDDPEIVPEPSSMVLFGAGLLGLMGYGLRRRRRLTR